MKNQNPSKNTLSERRVLNENELAERWGLSVKTLQRWRCMSLGPTYLKLGNRVGYRQEDIDQYERDVLRHGSGDRVFA